MTKLAIILLAAATLFAGPVNADNGKRKFLIDQCGSETGNAVQNLIEAYRRQIKLHEEWEAGAKAYIRFLEMEKKDAQQPWREK